MHTVALEVRLGADLDRPLPLSHHLLCPLLHSCTEHAQSQLTVLLYQKVKKQKENFSTPLPFQVTLILGGVQVISSNPPVTAVFPSLSHLHMWYTHTHTHTHTHIAVPVFLRVEASSELSPPSNRGRGVFRLRLAIKGWALNWGWVPRPLPRIRCSML